MSGAIDQADAQTAAYLRLGMESGIFDNEKARNWAFSVIEARDQPPVEIIEVAISHDRGEVLALLGKIAGTTDLRAVLSWLLSELLTELRQESRTLRGIANDASHMAYRVDGQSNLYFTFDSIAEDIWLAVHNRHGMADNLALLRKELERELAANGEPFPYTW